MLSKAPTASADTLAPSTGRPDAVRAFAEALAEHGVGCRVEAREALAVLYAGPPVADSLADARRRQTVLAIARTHGFTHVAVSIGDD